MSMYVDKTYYISNYKGTLSTNDVEKYLRIASNDVDTLTFNRINVDKLTPFQLNIIKEVVCEYAEFYYEHEEEINSGLSSYSINGVSMSFNTSEGVQFISGVYIPLRIYNHLAKTGLCRRCLNIRV